MVKRINECNGFSWQYRMSELSIGTKYRMSQVPRRTPYTDTPAGRKRTGDGERNRTSDTTAAFALEDILSSNSDGSDHRKGKAQRIQ